MKIGWRFGADTPVSRIVKNIQARGKEMHEVLSKRTEKAREKITKALPPKEVINEERAQDEQGVPDHLLKAHLTDSNKEIKGKRSRIV